MKARIYFLFILSIFVVSCGNKEQAQKYALLKQETKKQMSQTDLVIKDQQVKIDSMNKIGIDYVARRIPAMDIEGVEDAINDASDVQSAMRRLQTELMMQDLNYTILEKANANFGYFFKGRKSVIRNYEQRMRETNSEIDRITKGLTINAYLNKYLPKEMQ